MAGRDEPEPEHFSEAEVNALMYQVSNFGLRIVDKTDEGAGGSGVPIRIDSRVFIATAAHVIPPDHTFTVVPRPAEEAVTAFVARHIDSDADVGLLEIAPEQAGYLEDRTCSLGQMSAWTHGDRQLPVIVVGYPGRYFRLLKREQLDENHVAQHFRCDALCYDTSTIPASEWPSEALTRAPEKSRDVFLHFKPDGRLRPFTPTDAGSPWPVVEENLPHLAGLSGGGIWLQAAQNSGLWRPAGLLVALQVSFKPREGWLRGTVIRVWLELVARKYPDLRKTVAPMIEEAT